ncbi:MAG: putative ABC transporter permease [Oscillospiraceae bacterium]|nr:putative ABC transporter permease [Oscillospiraceae bacterium]
MADNAVKTTACVSEELEQLCAAAPALLERTAAGLEERYYTRLAEEAQPNTGREPRPASQELEAEVGRELETLRRAARYLSAAHQRAVVLEDELGARLKDMRTSRDRKWYALNPPANAAIDLAESRQKHFAQGIGLYKVLLLFAAGCVGGVVVEMFWSLATRGHVEIRSGMVYGPFNAVYGIGAVVLTVCLYQFRNRGAIWSFLGGFLVGSVVEYGCSWIQEALFGSRSWDYSSMPLNLNGRICVTYSLFWGLLGVLWIKDLYPRMAKWILKIPNRIGKPVTWVLTAFLIVNGAVSCVAVSRWSERAAGLPADSAFWELIDERFPDERMESIFINMKLSS